MERGVSDALWLTALQRICDLAAHEVRGALNGVSVNLEVVRSRAEKPDAPASNVAKFAASASQQLEAVLTMSDALLALARPAREPVEVARVMAQMCALLAPAAKADGRKLTMTGVLDDAAVTSASGTVVRVAIGECLLAAATQAAEVECRLMSGEATPAIRVESCGGTPMQVHPETVAAVRDAGIQIIAEPSALIIRFPARSAGAVETA